MDRREFFKLKNNKRNYRQITTGLTPYAGSWTVNEASHLLKRTLFGARKPDIDFLLTLSPGAAVDELLNNIPASVSTPLRDYGLISDMDGNLYDDLGVVQGQTWVNDLNTLSNPEVTGSINSLRVDSLHKWWAGLILNQNRSIWEKMVMFWQHHFSVQEEEIGNATMLWRHHNLLRSNAMGNIKQLTKDVTIDPAMLIHLNGLLNSKLAPDENYARELQELFTVGRGNDSLYTENDVIAAARVLTGWRIDGNTYTSYFDAGDHDTGSKGFSAFYNNTTITNNGATEVNALIDMIFATTEAARFICRKLYTWFVYYQIDAATETNVIIPLADIFRTNNYDIRPVLDTLFKSEHFFDVQNQACFIKNPFDIIVGTLREFNTPVPPYTDWQNGYPVFSSVYGKASEMQMELYQPPDVSGWPTYYQEPMYYELWVNSNSLPKRADYTDALVSGSVIDVRAFANYSSNPSSPNQLIDDVTSLMLRYPLSAASKNYIKQNFLVNNTNNDSVWTNAWNTNNTAVIDSSLRNMFTFIMNLPEYHLC
jgi:uncharacterized protein (DUF1800 family)